MPLALPARDSAFLGHRPPVTPPAFPCPWGTNRLLGVNAQVGHEGLDGGLNAVALAGRQVELGRQRPRSGVVRRRPRAKPLSSLNALPKQPYLERQLAQGLLRAGVVSCQQQPRSLGACGPAHQDARLARPPCLVRLLCRASKPRCTRVRVASASATTGRPATHAPDWTALASRALRLASVSSSTRCVSRATVSRSSVGLVLTGRGVGADDRPGAAKSTSATAASQSRAGSGRGQRARGTEAEG